MSVPRDQVNATLALLCQRFPKTFFMYQGRRKPLKIGIRDDIVAVLGNEIEPKLLHHALRHYTLNFNYLHARTLGAERIDLDGNAAGHVSEEDALSAKRALA